MSDWWHTFRQELSKRQLKPKPDTKQSSKVKTERERQYPFADNNWMMEWSSGLSKKRRRKDFVGERATVGNNLYFPFLSLNLNSVDLRMSNAEVSKHLGFKGRFEAGDSLGPKSNIADVSFRVFFLRR
jgi:hypothetical protein